MGSSPIADKDVPRRSGEQLHYAVNWLAQTAASAGISAAWPHAMRASMKAGEHAAQYLLQGAAEPTAPALQLLQQFALASKGAQLRMEAPQTVSATSGLCGDKNSKPWEASRALARVAASELGGGIQVVGQDPHQSLNTSCVEDADAYGAVTSGNLCLRAQLLPSVDALDGAAVDPTADARLLPHPRGSIANLRWVRREGGPSAPPPGHVRVAVRAVGLNFRDLLNVLGMYPGDPGEPGADMAGVVQECGPGVDTFVPGKSKGGGLFVKMVREFVTRLP